jgi:ketosteroid isomerase-like protein
MHPNEELARRELQALASGDTATLATMYADDLVLHYPGRNPLAGDHRDLDDFVARFQGLMGEDGTVTRELHDALGSDDHAIQLLTVTANARGETHTWRATVIMHTRDGKISEAWIHVDDQYALDGFLNSLAGS